MNLFNQRYDDSFLWESVRHLQKRIEKLETKLGMDSSESLPTPKPVNVEDITRTMTMLVHLCRSGEQIVPEYASMCFKMVHDIKAHGVRTK